MLAVVPRPRRPNRGQFEFPAVRCQDYTLPLTEHKRLTLFTATS